MQIYFFSYLSEATVFTVIPNWITHAIFKIFDKTIKICNKILKTEQTTIVCEQGEDGHHM